MSIRRSSPAPSDSERRFGAGVILLAVLVAWGSYVLGASLPTPANGRPIGGKVGVSKGKGFDTCGLPTVSQMQSLWNETIFAYIGFYVGGVIAKEIGCNKLTKAQINELHATGYDYLLIMDGRQPPCSEESTTFFSEDPTNGYQKAREQAANEVDVAVRRMEELGFTTPGSIVYYDLESWTFTGKKGEEHPHCAAATYAFVNNWDRRLLLEYEASSGLYGPIEGAHLNSFWTEEAERYRPDDIWISEVRGADPDENQSVWAVNKTNLPETHWPDRRLHQWKKDIPYLIEGKTYKFNYTCSLGLVAGSGGKRDQPECQAK
jgi:Domain of unknown function (DUF1906)